MNEYLNQIEISGITYDLVASGGTESGVTSGEVQTMLEEYTYDKQTIDDKISSGGGSSSAVTVLSGDVITISGDVISLSGDVQNISGDVIVLSGDVIALETKLDTLSGNVYTKSETSGKTELDTEFGKYYKKTETSSKTEIDDALNQKQDILIAGSGISIVNNVISASGGGITSGEVMDIVSGYTYDKDTIDDKIASGGTFDPTLYYKKSETSGKTELSTEFEKYYKKTETSGKTEIQNALDLKLDASAFTESDYYKKTETSGKTELSTEFAKYYKKDETSGKTELSTEFAKYYKKSETSSKTEIDDALDDKQDELVAGNNITISGNVISASSGTKYTAGRAINITTGATADTISFDLPIYKGGGASDYHSLVFNYGGNVSSSNDTSAFGRDTKATGQFTLAEGYWTQATGRASHAEGSYTKAIGVGSHAEGQSTTANNPSEHASGQYNISSKASNTFGDSGNTLFSVGNGMTGNSTHNALEIRQSGDIYIADTNASGAYNQKPMIKLQDALGQSGGITSGEVQTMIDQSISGKANSSDVYEKTETYTKTEVNNAISNKIQCLSEAEWEQISGSTVLDTLYLIY